MHLTFIYIVTLAFFGNLFAAEKPHFNKVYLLRNGYFVAFEQSIPPTIDNSMAKRFYFGKLPANKTPGWNKLYETRFNYHGINEFGQPFRYENTETRTAAFSFDFIYEIDEQGKPLLAHFTEKYEVLLADPQKDSEFIATSIEFQCDDKTFCGKRDDDALTSIRKDLNSGKLELVPSAASLFETQAFRLETYNDRYIIAQENLLSAKMSDFKLYILKSGKLTELNIRNRRHLLTSQVETSNGQPINPQSLKTIYSFHTDILNHIIAVELMPDLIEIRKDPKYADNSNYQSLIRIYGNAASTEPRAFRLLRVEPSAAEKLLEEIIELKKNKSSNSQKQILVTPCQVMFL